MPRAAYADQPDLRPKFEPPPPNDGGAKLLYFPASAPSESVPEPLVATAPDWPPEVLDRAAGKASLLQYVIDIIQDEARRSGFTLSMPPTPRAAWSHEYNEDGIDIEAEVDAPIEQRLDLWTRIAEEIMKLEERPGIDGEFLSRVNVLLH